MKKSLGFVSGEIDDNLSELAKRLDIDLTKFKPVMFENYPFFSIYCIDIEKSTAEKEFITKFEIIILELDGIDDLLSKINMQVAIDKKYFDIELNKGLTIYFPKSD
jgi:energy-converting hydrogenase A subunit M